MDLGGDGHILNIKDNVTGMGRLLLHVEVDISADHHGGELFDGGVFGVDRADVSAFAEDGAAVGNLHDLVELMGDKENGLAFSGEILHDLHELGDFLRGEDGSGLIKNENFIVAIEHFENFGSLLHADSDVFNFGIRINMKAVLFREGHNLFAGFFLLQEPHFVRLNTHNDVVKNGEAFHQLEMLMNHTDAESIGIIWVVDFHFHPVFFDDAFLRLIKTEEHTHQGALARTVFSEQCMNFAFFQLKGDIIIGNDTGESFGNVQHFYSILLQNRPASFSMNVKTRIKI